MCIDLLSRFLDNKKLLKKTIFAKKSIDKIGDDILRVMRLI